MKTRKAIRQLVKSFLEQAASTQEPATDKSKRISSIMGLPQDAVDFTADIIQGRVNDLGYTPESLGYAIGEHGYEVAKFIIKYAKCYHEKGQSFGELIWMARREWAHNKSREAGRMLRVVGFNS